ncbi:hypothetical protein BDV34DRAFT_204742 [Aspergillus parasiticus]|uniref:Uncharacterized protein n=1 Tax=Aspergillus parasiticus TaxID=5067 RepID=A0A5N6D8R3_ASPPA|nr:hypothetical protein BDV34DRAFT_204742 [Aspergillus parasiticus]
MIKYNSDTEYLSSDNPSRYQFISTNKAKPYGPQLSGCPQGTYLTYPWDCMEIHSSCLRCTRVSTSSSIIDQRT